MGKFNNQLLEVKKVGNKINTIIARVKEEAVLCEEAVEIVEKQAEIVCTIERVAKGVGKEARAQELYQHKFK